jgi:hypothetical protein
MKLSKPEDMDEMGEPSEEQSEAVENRAPSASETVEVFGTEMPVANAVRSLADTVENPVRYGLANVEEVGALRERVEEQEQMIEEQKEAIAELAEAVEILSQTQAEIGETGSGATVALDADRLGGIYDPTEEF